MIRFVQCAIFVLYQIACSFLSLAHAQQADTGRPATDAHGDPLRPKLARRVPRAIHLRSSGIPSVELVSRF